MAHCQDAREGPGSERTSSTRMHEDFRSSKMHSIILCFQDPDTEAKYLAEVAAWRWPVLLIIFCFDILIWAIRAWWQVFFIATYTDECDASDIACLEEGPVQHLLRMSASQVTNLCVLHGLLWVMNFRSRRTGEAAARQEECLLAVLIALAVTNLIFCLSAENASDYIYAVFFLICCASYVKVRWWLAMGAMILPTCTAMFKSARVLPPSSKQHMVVAWLAGALMSWLAESYRRCTFANQQAARMAHVKELEEKSRHLAAQEELATAREEAAQRALVVMREKAANEAKSEFMSLMCHEVRTPLNGCLASAEMLLDTPLLDEQRELTNTIRISGSILLSTVSNFLDFFKVQAGKKLDIVRTPFYLTDLVADAHAIVDAMMGQNKKVQLLPPQSEMAAVCLMGDPDRLKGVLLNLFSNAAKFTPSGFICVRLRKCMAQEVASETHINPERSYKMCLQALQKMNQKDNSMDSMNGMQYLDGMGRSQCMDSVSSGVSSVFVASAPGGHRGVGASSHRGSTSLTWWEEWLENGKEPDWDAWHACTLPPRSRSEMASNECEQEESPPNLTEIRGAARTTRSDPGRRKKQSPSRRDCHNPNATNATSKPPTPPQSRPSVAFSDVGSRASASAPDSSSSGSKDSQRGPGNDGGYVNDSDPKAGIAHSIPSNRPNSRSAMDLPGQVIVVEVVDTGVGVPEEARKRLFSKFVQGSEKEMEKARAVSGTGLGLSICAKQMNVLGGTIGATSNPGSGSIFWFCFPVEEVPVSDAAKVLPHSSSWHPSPTSNSPYAQPLSTSTPNLPGTADPSGLIGSGCSAVTCSTYALSSTAASKPGMHAVDINNAARPSSHTNLSSSLQPSSSSPQTRSSTAMRSSGSTQHTAGSSGSYTSHNDYHRSNRHAFAHSQMLPDDYGRASPKSAYSPEYHSNPAYNSTTNSTFYRPQQQLNVLQEDHSTGSPTASSKLPEASAGSMDGIFTTQEDRVIPEGGSGLRQVRAPPGAAPLFLSLASDSLLYKPLRSTTTSVASKPQSVNGVRVTTGDISDTGGVQQLRSAVSMGGAPPLRHPMGGAPPLRQTVDASDNTSFATEQACQNTTQSPIHRSVSSNTLSMAMPQQQSSHSEKTAQPQHNVAHSFSSAGGMHESASTSPRDASLSRHPLPHHPYGMPPDYSMQLWAAHVALLYGMPPPAVPAVALPVAAHMYGRYPAATMPGPHMVHPWLPPHMPGAVPPEMLQAALAAPLPHSPHAPADGAQPCTAADTGGAAFAAAAAVAPHSPLSHNGSFGPHPGISPSPSANSLTAHSWHSGPTGTAHTHPTSHAYSPADPHFLHWSALQQMSAQAYGGAMHSHPGGLASYPVHPGYIAHVPPLPTHVGMPHPSSHLAAPPHAYDQHLHRDARADAPLGLNTNMPSDAIPAGMHVDPPQAFRQGSQPCTKEARVHMDGEGTRPTHAYAPQVVQGVAPAPGSGLAAGATKGPPRHPSQTDRPRVAGPSAPSAQQQAQARRSCDRVSVQGSQGEASSICGSLDAWAVGGVGTKPPSQQGSFEEARGHFHVEGIARPHRSSLDHSLRSASAPRQNSLSLQRGRAVSVPHGMPGVGLEVSDDGDPSNTHQLPTAYTTTTNALAFMHENDHAGASPHMHGIYPADEQMHVAVSGSYLEPSELGGATSAEVAAWRVHVNEKKQHVGLRFTPMANVPEGGNESSAGEMRKSATSTGDLPQLPPAGAVQTGAPSPADAAAAAAKVASAPQPVPAHVQSGGSAGASTRSSLDAMGGTRMSSLDVTSGMFHHAGSDGGSRSWASQRSFGDEEVGSGGGEFGIDGVRVLVAEDNLINQMVAKKMLAALGATVSVVSNGQEAVNIVCATQCRQSEDTNYDASQTDSSRDTGSENECAFDVVLMDMAMPQMDGLQATLELRRRGCKIPIVAMTANVSDRDRATCHDSGMDGFLSKPILKGRLGRAIRQVIACGTLFPPSMVAEQAARKALQQPGAEGGAKEDGGT